MCAEVGNARGQSARRDEGHRRRCAAAQATTPYVVGQVGDTAHELEQPRASTRCCRSVKLRPQRASTSRTSTLSRARGDQRYAATRSTTPWSATAGTRRNRLDGKTGVDRMYGGAGDDTYVVSQTGDKAWHEGGGRRHRHGAVLDQLRSHRPVHREADPDRGVGAQPGTGNLLDNSLTGNSAANVLDGGAGNDILRGNGGNDTSSASRRRLPWWPTRTSSATSRTSPGNNDLIRLDHHALHRAERDRAALGGGVQGLGARREGQQRPHHLRQRPRQPVLRRRRQRLDRLGQVRPSRQLMRPSPTPTSA